MGSAQKYSLKWNDFTVNVASTFRDLHTRNDFVDVTLACSDGSTLEAHKVILSSVSTYFRDILKTTPCKHPIIILKDTCREEASAMLEFAYTGEVNVAQELLPSLLHTARSFRIKGLDKVESPVVEVPQPAHILPHQAAAAAGGMHAHWPASSGPPTRSHSPSSIHSGQDVKPHPFLTNVPENTGKNVHGRREREVSPPASLSGSQPPTREGSPCPTGASSNARTPPPKRWKRSFDMSHSAANSPASTTPAPPPAHNKDMVPENYSTSRPDYEPSKRYVEPNPPASASSGARSFPYPHSMPTSPTMFERGNELRLAGLFRHHLANSDVPPPSRATTSVNGAAAAAASPAAAHQQTPNSQSSRPGSAASSHAANGAPSVENGRSEYDPVDYRCFSSQSKAESAQGEYRGSRTNSIIAPSGTTNNGTAERACDEDSIDRERFANHRAAVAAVASANGSNRRNSLVFRPESAPTVLDMSPDGNSNPAIAPRSQDLIDSQRENAEHMISVDDDPMNADCLGKNFNIQPDAMGRYSCDECGKIFKHPGSLQHHRHIHRGTHRCPSCGKAFSRRWDMERHLNKSKYGCPANRFSTGSAGSSGSGSAAVISLASSQPATPTPMMGTPTAAHIVAASPMVGHLELLSVASSVHNTTA